MTKKEELARALVKGTVEMVPYAGGLLSNMLDVYLPQTLKSRREKIIEQLASEIEEAVSINSEVENSLKIEENQTLLLKLFKLSEMELEADKLEKLRNVYVNSLFDKDVGIDKKGYFLSLVSNLTIKHILILKILDDPSAYLKLIKKDLNIMSGDLESLFEVAIDDYKGHSDFYKIIYHNLVDQHLLAKGGLGGMMSKGGVLTSRTSQFGKEFLKYLNKPTRDKK